MSHVILDSEPLPDPRPAHADLEHQPVPGEVAVELLLLLVNWCNEKVIIITVPKRFIISH